jgi:hypothetical protein
VVVSILEIARALRENRYLIAIFLITGCLPHLSGKAAALLYNKYYILVI